MTTFRVWNVAALTVVTLATANALRRESSVMETIAAFDTNHNGKVDKYEIEAGARSQGLRVEDVLGDFQDMDTNGDGELDVAELTNVIGAKEKQQNEATAAAPASSTADRAATLTENKGQNSHVSAQVRVAKEAENIQNDIDSRDGSALLLDAKNVEHDAQKQASNVLARSLTEKANQLFTQSNADAKSATEFEALAKSLRGSVRALLKRSDEEMKRTAKQATGNKVQASLPKVQELQHEEMQLKQQAVEHRTLAHEAVERLRRAQGDMTTFLK